LSHVKVIYEGATEDAEEMSFSLRPGSTVRASYELPDGTVLDLVHDVRAIYKLLNKKKPDGSPIFLLTGEVNIKAMTVQERDGGKLTGEEAQK
jgi:hypothetical protein